MTLWGLLGYSFSKSIDQPSVIISMRIVKVQANAWAFYLREEVEQTGVSTSLNISILFFYHILKGQNSQPQPGSKTLAL